MNLYISVPPCNVNYGTHYKCDQHAIAYMLVQRDWAHKNKIEIQWIRFTGQEPNYFHIGPNHLINSRPRTRFSFSSYRHLRNLGN